MVPGQLNPAQEVNAWSTVRHITGTLAVTSMTGHITGGSAERAEKGEEWMWTKSPPCHVRLGVVVGTKGHSGILLDRTRKVGCPDCLITNSLLDISMFHKLDKWSYH